MSVVGIRALKQNASEVIDRAEAGEIVTITRRGKAVARVVPIRKSKLDEMRGAGLIREATKKPWDLSMPTHVVESDRTLGEILQEMRDDERY